MAVVAVINRKGGSGKSTLATHLAAYCASAGLSVILGDVDRQQSIETWLRQRKTQPLRDGQQIGGWNVDSKAFVRPPAGVEHVILDTPGGLRGFELARVVMYADAILMPVCNSIFDRASAADCLAELRTLPRVSSGRCKVAAIGMRLDARTKSAEVMEAWAASHDVPFIAVLRESQAYVRCIEKGLTLFDLPTTQVKTDLVQWKPIIQWLRPVLQPALKPTEPQKEDLAIARESNPPAKAILRDAPRRAAEPVVARGPALRLSGQPTVRRAPSAMSRLIDALPIPRFLQRTP